MRWIELVAWLNSLGWLNVVNKLIFIYLYLFFLTGRAFGFGIYGGFKFTQDFIWYQNSSVYLFNLYKIILITNLKDHYNMMTTDILLRDLLRIC